MISYPSYFCVFVLLGWLLHLVGSSNFTLLFHALEYILYISVSLTKSHSMCFASSTQAVEVQMTLEVSCCGYGAFMLLPKSWKWEGVVNWSESPSAEPAFPVWQMCSSLWGSKMGKEGWNGNWIYLCSLCRSDRILKHLSPKNHNHLIHEASQPACVKSNFALKLHARGKEKVLLIVCADMTHFCVSDLYTHLFAFLLFVMGWKT